MTEATGTCEKCEGERWEPQMKGVGGTDSHNKWQEARACHRLRAGLLASICTARVAFNSTSRFLLQTQTVCLQENVTLIITHFRCSCLAVAHIFVQHAANTA